MPAQHIVLTNRIRLADKTHKENDMSDNQWKEAIARWRRLPPEERRRCHLEAIPRHVADFMAMEGEPVSEERIRKHLESLLSTADKRLFKSKPAQGGERKEIIPSTSDAVSQASESIHHDDR